MTFSRAENVENKLGFSPCCCVHDFTTAHKTIRRNVVHSPVVRSTGEAHSGSYGSSIWRGESELSRVEPAGKPAGAPSAEAWSQAGRAGGNMCGAGRRDDRGSAGGAESRRGLCASGSGVSGGTAAIYRERQRTRGRARAGEHLRLTEKSREWNQGNWFGRRRARK